MHTGCTQPCVNDHLAWIPRQAADAALLSVLRDFDDCDGSLDASLAQPSPFLALGDFGTYLRASLGARGVAPGRPLFVPYTIERPCGAGSWASYERARQPAAPHLGAVEELLEAEKEVFRERQLMDVFCAMSPFEGGRAATPLDVGGGPHNSGWYALPEGTYLSGEGKDGTPLVSPDVDDPSAALIQLVLDIQVAMSRLGGEWMDAGNIERNLGDAFAELPYHGWNSASYWGMDLPAIASEFFTGSDRLSPQEMEVLQSVKNRRYYLRPKRDEHFVRFWHPLDDLPPESWMRDSLARPPQTLRRWVETRGDRPRPARIVVDVADVTFSAREPLCVDREAAALVANALYAFFSVEVVLRDSSLEVRCPPRKQRKMRGDLAGYTEHVNGYTGPQVDADALIQWAAKQRDAIEAPAPGDVSVCLCACDLYSTKAPWNFLWGWSKTFLPGGRDAPHDGAAPILLSLARGGTADRPPEPPEIMPGSVRVPHRPPRAGVWAGTPGLAHLLTHHVRTVAVAAFGLGQCALARCVFNGVGCDEELAACPWEPCPCCLRKLQRAGAVKDAKHLFARLAAFLGRHEATAREAAFLQCRLNNM